MVKVRLRKDDKWDIKAYQAEIEYEDVHHFKYTYRMIHDFFKEFQYVDIDGYGDKVEQLYWERGQPSGNTEHQIWWRATKRINRFVRYFLKFNYQTLYHGKHETMFQGHKMKTNMADSIFRIEMYVQFDYNNKFKDHWFLKHFENIFMKRIYLEKRKMHRQEAYSDAIKLTNKIKRALGMKTPISMPKSFRSEKMIT